MISTGAKLRIEKSQNTSGILRNTKKIFVLKEEDYYVVDIGLDGDAPKQFIKAYFFERDSGVKRRNRSTWTPFIAKSAEKWYPHESVVEFMINKIGLELGLTMNEVRLAIANTQIRFLSRYFLKSNEVLVHGAEICGEYLEDNQMAAEIANNKKTSRELFTFEFICKAIDTVFPEAAGELKIELVKMITFDAIVGNNDRHFYNWGVINSVKKTGKRPKFAPIYDSARGLLWNESEENIVKHYENIRREGKKLVNYVQQAKPRISIEEDAEINHFGLIAFIRSYSDEYKSVVDDLLAGRNEEKVLKMLREEVFLFFSPERQDLITRIIKERFSILRNE
jgi:glycerol-3-phosphate cytidylyltransferase-like family protein